MRNRVLLVGTGQHAREYAKVLRFLEQDFDIVGNRRETCEKISKELDVIALYGGVERNKESIIRNDYSCFINSGPAESLALSTQFLTSLGLKKGLIEKPAILDESDIEIYNLIQDRSQLFVGYNRRFYGSTRKVMKMIEEDGGITSFNFDFSEWPSRVENKESLSNRERSRWFFYNSTHIIDLAFYICGKPSRLYSTSSGKNKIKWHLSSSKWAGSGISCDDITFSYRSDWMSPSRWVIEIFTKNRKIVMCPIEEVKTFDCISMTFSDVALEKSDRFKPGLLDQTSLFLSNDYDSIKTLDDQISDYSDIFLKIFRGEA